MPNAHFLNATLTLYQRGATGLRLHLPVCTTVEQARKVVAGRGQLLLVTLTPSGWELTLYCAENAQGVLGDIEVLCWQAQQTPDQPS